MQAGLLTVAAVTIVGISKGGFGGGFGMLAVPMMALAMPPMLAAAILLPVLCAMDLMALRAYWGKWSLEHIKITVPAAIIGTIAGAFTFQYLNADHIRFVIGVISAGFALNSWFKPAQRWIKHKPGVNAGRFWGFTSGFTSFVSHTGGPPLSVYLLPQQLEKSTLQATTVLFFTAVNYFKLIPYALLGQLNFANIKISLLLLPVAALAIGLGVYLHKRVSDKMFYQITYIVLFVTGLKLMYDGWQGF
ncbi:MAG: sulfite exporter TauE/SafE family protein [Thiolinea sp.]